MQEPKEPYKENPEDTVIEPEVQVMSRDDRDSFQGLTIDQGDREQENAGYQSGAGKSGIYVRHYNWSSPGLLTKVIIGIVLIAIVSGAAIIGGALLVVAAIGWLLSKLFRR